MGVIMICFWKGGALSYNEISPFCIRRPNHIVCKHRHNRMRAGNLVALRINEFDSPILAYVEPVYFIGDITASRLIFDQ